MGGPAGVEKKSRTVTRRETPTSTERSIGLRTDHLRSKKPVEAPYRAVLVIPEHTERHSSYLAEGWAPTPTPASNRSRRRAKYREVQSQHKFNTLSK